jgi:hypothetical protein
MSVLLEALTFGASWRQRQDRVEPIERLNRRLFVDAEHHGVLGGSRYRPITSAAFVSNSGSVDRIHRSIRCTAARHAARATIVCCTRSLTASTNASHREAAGGASTP